MLNLDSTRRKYMHIHFIITFERMNNNKSSNFNVLCNCKGRYFSLGENLYFMEKKYISRRKCDIKEKIYILWRKTLF